MNDIYKMELHDSFFVKENLSVLRVAGGWIYTIGYSQLRTVFVPFDSEFYIMTLGDMNLTSCEHTS